MAPKLVTTNEKTTTTMTCFILQYNDYICNAQFKQSSNVVYMYTVSFYPRRARSAIGVDTVFTLYVCMYVSALERKRLIGMT